MRNWKNESTLLALSAGIILPGVETYVTPENIHEVAMAADAAQPLLQSQGNAGIPAFLRNIADPRVVDVLLTQLKAAKIAGEDKRGDWTNLSLSIPVGEHAGEVSSYGDFSNNGMVSSNVEWEWRQAYHYQTITQWGEQELAVMGVAKIDYVSRLNIASAEVMNRYQNKTYFFGVANLANYGLLNDPSLLPSLTPGSKTGGGTAWSAASLGTEVYADVVALVTQLVAQSGGLVDKETTMKLCLSPGADLALTKIMSSVWGNATALNLIKSNFPNLTVETAPEYATASGGLAQLIVPEYEGIPTVRCEFTEKQRAFGIVKDLSAFKQKKMGGTWGCIVRRPVFIASMLGI